MRALLPGRALPHTAHARLSMFPGVLSRAHYHAEPNHRGLEVGNRQCNLVVCGDHVRPTLPRSCRCVAYAEATREKHLLHFTYA